MIIVYFWAHLEMDWVQESILRIVVASLWKNIAVTVGPLCINKRLLQARKAWNENADIIENLDNSEPAPEEVLFNLQKAHETLTGVGTCFC